MDFVFTLLKAFGLVFVVALVVGGWVAVADGARMKKYIALRDLILGNMRKFKPTEFHNELAFDKTNGALAIIRNEQEGVRVIMIDPKTIIESECVVNGRSHSVTKNNKSTLLRAAAGGILLGPVGAVVGAISAQGDTKTTTNEVKDYKLRISLDRPDVQMLMVKFYTEESMMLWNSFVGIAMRRTDLLEESPPFARYENAAAVERHDDGGDESVLSGDLSVREKLENIEALRDEGFMSDKEYEQAKAKLLLPS